MEYNKSGSRFFLRIDKGEEIVETIKKFCTEHKIKAGSVSGIGATNSVVIGLFETKTKEYHKEEFSGDFEIAPLAGNISRMNGETYLHLHINIAGPDHRAFAGHLSSAVVSATCEVIIDTTDTEIDREFSDEIGLNLFKF